MNVPYDSRETIDSKIDKLNSQYLLSGNKSPDFRANNLNKLAEVLLINKQELAHLITQEMGKIISLSLAEVDRSISMCTFYSENVKKFTQSKTVHINDSMISGYRVKGLGVIYKICPFNFPLALIFKMVCPNLTCGNTVLVRIAHSCPQLAQKLDQLFKASNILGIEFVYNNPFNDTEYILQNPKVQGVSFTGSTGSGSKIAELAGKHQKRSVLELGGNDPFVVLEDADLDLAIKTAIDGRIKNSGRICTAPKRFIISTSKIEEFSFKLVEKVNKIKLGDPQKPDTEMGPLAREDLLNCVDQQIKASVEHGDTLLAGGSKQGTFFQPTVIKLKDLDSLLWKEEVFGPVFSLVSYKDEEEALKLANDTKYGLAAIVIGKDIEKAAEFASNIEAGTVSINQVTASYLQLPFGGTKSSGYGRESSHHGVEAFASLQAYCIKS